MPTGIYKREEGKKYGLSACKNIKEVRKKIKLAKSLKNYKGKNGCNWKGGKTIDANGYVWIFKPEHPKAIHGQYVFEHRLVMEEKIGRYLESGEEVHHINFIKDDNRIENLKLYKTKSQHRIEDWKDKKYRKNGEKYLEKARKKIGGDTVAQLREGNAGTFVIRG